MHGDSLEPAELELELEVGSHSASAVSEAFVSALSHTHLQKKKQETGQGIEDIKMLPSLLPPQLTTHAHYPPHPHL